jgi:LysM repeat protein
LTPTVTRTPTRSIILPTATPRATATPTGTPTLVPPVEYTVKNGDTPGRIALLYDLTVPELMTYNSKAEDDVIVVGEVLKIPPPTPKPTETATGAPGASPPPPANEVVYTVQSGDTLSGISQKFHVPLSRIQERNNIQNIQSLQVGDQLVIPVAPTPTFTPGPGASSAAATTPTPQIQYPLVTLLTPARRRFYCSGCRPASCSPTSCILSKWSAPASGPFQPAHRRQVFTSCLINILPPEIRIVCSNGA